MATSSLPPKLPLSELTATSVQTTLFDEFLMAPGIIEGMIRALGGFSVLKKSIVDWT
jgi:hypothetical protein